MTPLDASTLPLLDWLPLLQARLAGDAAVVEVIALDPDRGSGRYPGETVEIGGTRYVHRSLATWVELAEKLGLRLMTPRAAEPPCVRLRFERLGRARDIRRRDAVAPTGEPDRADRTEPADRCDPADRIERTEPIDITDRAAGAGRADRGDPTEKYGAASDFARRRKLEDPRFVLDLTEALARVPLPPAPRVLALGCNTGDELVLVLQRAPAARITGLDHSASALAVAQTRYPAATFVETDLATLPGLALGTFDLVLSIDTLQSPAIDDRVLVRHLVLERLAPSGSLVLGFPNGRYRDGELEYGARMVNFTEPELGLLVKDVAFYRRYLAQHHRRVFVTGKHEVLLTAIPLR